MIKVYVVEDNPHLLDDAVSCLSSLGFDCYGASDARKLSVLITAQLPDVVVLDRILPGEDGLTISKRLRDGDKTSHVGIVFLTACGDLDERIEGLEFADSYLVKPIDYRELAAVITSIHRRSLSVDSFSEQKNWRLHEKTLELSSPFGGVIAISYREYVVLRELSQSLVEPVSAQHIVETWGEDWLTYEKNRLELLLSRLRVKIKSIDSGNINPIRSIRNQGYHLMIAIDLQG